MTICKLEPRHLPSHRATSVKATMRRLLIGLASFALVFVGPGDFAPIAGAQTVTNSGGAQRRPPTLEEVFGSVRDEWSPRPVETDKMLALALSVAALVLILVAVRNWHRRSSGDQPLKHHGKLLREVTRRANVPSSACRAMRPLAQAENICSPLVAIVCPSVLKKLSDRASTEAQRDAIADVAHRITEGLRRGRPTRAEATRGQEATDAEPVVHHVGNESDKA